MRLFRKNREYAITPDRDEWVAPEETLVDASSHLSDVEVPVGGGVFRSAGWIAGILGIALLGGTFWLAIARHEELAQLAWRNRTVNVAVPPPRGIILDRNGVPLVENVPSFDMLVISRQVRQNPDGTFADIDIIARALGRESEELTLALNDAVRTEAVFFLATDVSRDAVLTLTNVLPEGFYLITSTKRQYADGPQLSHVIGYVGKVGRADIANDPYYLPSDTIGRLGVEASYEGVLRGTHGQLVFGASEETTDVAAAAGGNLVLNLDRELQASLYDSVEDVIRASGLTRAAAVVQDPSSGAVLGMVSFPSYDNNLFSQPLSQEDADALFNNRSFPLLNRAIAGQYNPGSTIKPMIGMAALQEGIMRADEVVNYDCISISIPNPTDAEQPYVFGNWRPDTGPFDLRRAIADSCNVYFFTVGGGHESIKGLGAQRIIDYLRNTKADSLLGIDLPGENTGFVPTPEWKRTTKKEPWYQGDTYNISIGQGDLVVTPLWINTYISAIANGGTLWTPQVASRVVDTQMKTLRSWQPGELGSLPFTSSVISQMQNAMRYAVTKGTAKILQDVGAPVAAKTGTAEVVKGKRVNSLLTAYAPADNPRIALTVLVEGSGESQAYALQAARQFLYWYFHRTAPPATPVPTPAPTASASTETIAP